MNSRNSASNLCPNCFSNSFFNQKCSVCGYMGLSFSENNIMLSPGIILNRRYILGRVLGAGGFGITYLAKDNLTGLLCAIKEYFPVTYAVRGTDKKIHPSGDKNEQFFKHGLDVFTNEAKILEGFRGNPSIVQIIEYFYDNNTAYFSMEYLDGVSLKALGKSMNGKIPHALAIEVLKSVLITLQHVHAKGMLHRDISPENILLTKKGEIKLIDFGATRYYVSEKSRNLSVILKPGFAPPEQYSSKGNQGPWTDIYALAATFYYSVTGQMVADSMDRLHDDRVPDIHELITGSDHRISKLIRRALELDHKKRYQNVTDMLNDLNKIPLPKAESAPPQNNPSQYKPNQPKDYKQQITDYKKRPERPAEVPAQNQNPNYTPPRVANTPIIMESIPYIQILRGKFAGNKWVIPKNIDICIGRNSSSCNIVIEDMNISRQHCIIRYDDKKGIFLVKDISTNGMYNAAGEKLTKDFVYAFPPGDELFLSNEDYKFKIGLDM